MKNIGVIVGRFQVPELHVGHCHLIDTVEGLHDHVLVVLGCTNIVSNRDPFSKDVRQALFHNTYPNITVTEIYDHPSDEQWSQRLDKIIMGLFPGDSITLYGSRDSFLFVYTGRFPIIFIPPISSPSGTDIRKAFFAKKK